MPKKPFPILPCLLTAYLISLSVTLFDVVLNVLVRPYNIRGFFDALSFIAEDGIANFVLIILVFIFTYFIIGVYDLLRGNPFHSGGDRLPYVFGVTAAVITVFVLTVQLKFNVMAGVFESKSLIVLVILVCAVPVLAIIFAKAGRLVRKLYRTRIVNVLYPVIAIIYAVVIAVGYSPRFGKVSGVSGDLSGRPNVLIIVIDALRRDHVSCYGYDTADTSNVNEFAARSVIFSDAYTNAPWTIPSMYTVFTSRYPSVHGAEFTRRGNDDLVMLAEILSENGYDTEAYIANSILDTEIGFDKGFDEYVMYEDFPPLMLIRRSTLYFLIEGFRDYKNRHGIADTTGWLTGILCKRLKAKRESPFFIWAHYLDPHQPLSPPREYVPDGPSSVKKAEEFMRRQKPHIEENDKDVAKKLYRSEVEYVDDSLRAVFKVLEDEGLFADTLVIITSDHGEEHFEHGKYGHGTTHYTEVMAVPLILYGPDLSPGVNDCPVSLIDIVPTVLSYVEIRGPDGLSGRDVLNLSQSEPAGSDIKPLYFGNTGPSEPTLRSIYMKPYILIRKGEDAYEYEFLDTKISGDTNDIIMDPDESTFERYKTALDSWASEVTEEARALGKRDEVKIDALRRKQLKDFGYF